jgi:uncharacterized coiled-coil protein SlyX
MNRMALKRFRYFLHLPLFLLLAFISSGCNRLEDEWRDAQEKDTMDGYQEFLIRHPGFQFTAQAESRIVELEWEAASHVNTIAAYEEFLEKVPTGNMANEARHRLEMLEWNIGSRKNTIEALQTFAQKWQGSTKALEARGKIALLIELISVSECIELAFLEWVWFEIDDIAQDYPAWLSDGPQYRQIARVVKVNNAALLKQSALWGKLNSMMISTGRLRAQETEWKVTKNGVKFEFAEDWDAPYILGGSKVEPIDFRRSSIELINGDVKYTKGLEARLWNKVSPDRPIILASEKPSYQYYKFQGQQWERLSKAP